MFKKTILKINSNLITFIQNKYLLFCLFLILFIFIPHFAYAGLFDGAPPIVDKLNSAFEKIQSWLLKLATPAAAVAVAVGIFMQKFSFGDEERIRVAKKIIRSTLFCYGFILVLDLILSAVKSLLT